MKASANFRFRTRQFIFSIQKIFRRYFISTTKKLMRKLKHYASHSLEEFLVQTRTGEPTSQVSWR